MTALARVGIGLLVAGIIAVLLPPFFTGGACTAEFDAASAGLQQVQLQAGTVSRLQAYLQSHATSYQLVPPDRCAVWAARADSACAGGPVFVIAIPVKNTVCRYYRDDSIRFQLAFNESQQLVRVQTDMKPFKYLKLPGGVEIAWAR